MVRRKYFIIIINESRSNNEKIEKPARYIGNEVNSVMKDKADVDIRFAMCFPDVYEI